MVAQFLAQKIKPEFIVDNDDVHIQTIGEWRKTDQGMNCHPLLWAALQLHLQAHLDNKVAVAQFMGEKAIEAQAPDDAGRTPGERRGGSAGKVKGSGKKESSAPAAKVGPGVRRLPREKAGRGAAGGGPSATS